MGSQRKNVGGLMLVTSFILLCPFCSPLAKGDVNFVELAKKVRPAVARPSIKIKTRWDKAAGFSSTRMGI